jgi:hypothetical protein
MTNTETHKLQAPGQFAEAHGSTTPRLYVFVRAGGFYALELASDDDARKNAECNPGTIRVENQNGESVWSNP